jgi:hypothetical protein
MAGFTQEALRHSIRIQNLKSNQLRQLIERNNVEKLGDPGHWDVAGRGEFRTIQQDLEISTVVRSKHLEETH